MDDLSGTPDGDSTPDPNVSGKLPEVIVIAEKGDLVLDVTFENSKDTIRSAKRAQPKFRLSGQEPPPVPKSRVRLAFRVDLGVLKKQSKYFEKLLGDARFSEARDIADAFAALSVRSIKPAAADAADLPWITIQDDDEATSHAFRDAAFADLLRILHGRDTVTKQAGMPFVATLAVLADRFDCTGAVSKHVAAGRLKFKWPVTSRRPAGAAAAARDETPAPSRSSNSSENVLRQKLLVSWLLNLPGKFQAATRELIMNGSCQWSSFHEPDDDDGAAAATAAAATWWYLQDGLEEELQYRRSCVLNTIASVQRHFLALYSARGARQCQLGYDSSGACDSYQLGEMFKFLTRQRLLFLADVSPASVEDGLAAAAGAAATLPVDGLLAALRQCPAYQIDKNHSNCGLRTRMLPILDFLQSLLSAGSVPLSRQAWRSQRRAAAWMPSDVAGEEEEEEEEEEEKKQKTRVFRYTRSLAGDQRLRFENAMGADRFARDVFTASSWDWTAEDQGPGHVSTTPRWFAK
ncbi:hypothetical protein GGR56DRAFT_364799 [Xylariaceae sp. FL0804]|nr:hypothetical protein GGR56DRAFT_364799 [Xylariaceae sp. FL0804]